MAKAAKGNLDDSLVDIRIQDFSGGLNTFDGPLTLASNETPQCQNVLGFPGRLLYNGGYKQESALPTSVVPDNSWEFYDSSNAKHHVIWVNGNMYDTASGSAVTIATGVYTPGQQIGRIDQFGVLYWITPTVGLQKYDGSTNSAVTSSGGAGNSGPPAGGSYLASFAGSLICGNPVYSAITNVGAFIYSNVNDPRTWLGANINNLGNNQFIEWIVPMGVSAAGVPPSGGFVIGTVLNVFFYEGPLNSLTQRLVNCPVGAKEPNSAVYLPANDLLGSVTFLGSDGQIWQTNGITATCVSVKILNLVYNLVQNAVVANPSVRFFGCYNERYQYYLIDMANNQQLAYRWQTNAWFYFAGWPSGCFFDGHDSNGYPVNLVAASNTGVVAPGVYTLGVDNALYGGGAPGVFYSTPYLHGGQPGVMKEYQWVELDFLNNYNTYTLQGSTLPNSANVSQSSNLYTFALPAVAQAQAVGSALWGVAIWGAALWGGSGSPYLAGPCTVKCMLATTVPVGSSLWVGVASTQPMRSNAASFTIAWDATSSTAGLPAMDLISFCVRIVVRGRKPIGGTGYSAQSGVIPVGSDPYS